MIMEKWDFGPDDEITYFDPTKSYWLTKYRPINREEGLDFNPDWFREDAITKLKTGTYSKHIYKSKTYNDFWKERFRRCTEGFECNGYRITGDNYFWLNFFRLKSSISGAKASAGRVLNFPMFLTFQYEYFHYVEMCELLGKDVGLLKARALGFSEMAASLCVRPFITTKNYRVLASAPSEKHLKPLLSKIWPQLDWLNDNTEGAFRRVRMVKNTDTHKRASVKSRDGQESGHMAEIEGVVADTPEKIRGDRTERIFFEEAGSDKVLKRKYLQAEALITVLGGDRVGTRIVWGTGGDEGPALAGIKDIVTKPDSFNILKYRHNHTPDQRYILTAMFIPAYAMVSKYVDSRGWCDPVLARKYYDEQRLNKADDPSGLLIYKAEYCYTIEEALIQQGDNIFPREEIANQIAEIEIYKNYKKPSRGYLIWERDREDNITGVKWVPDPNGSIQIIEKPLRTEDNLPYDNLYIGGIDSIDIGKNDSSTDDRASEYCIVIKKRVLGQADPMYVAMYKTRPRDIREAYDTSIKLLTWYNCKAVLESTRTAIITYFRSQKALHLLMKRPKSTMPNVTKGNPNMYGAPATMKVIQHYRELITDFILDYSFTIGFIEMLEQFLDYSDEKKKFFDIVAAVGMAELGDEELSVRHPTVREPESGEFRDIGYYFDSNGKKRFGIIPKAGEIIYETPRDSNTWLYKELI